MVVSYFIIEDLYFGRGSQNQRLHYFQEEGRFELEWIDTANAWYAERQRRSKCSQSTHLLYKAIQVHFNTFLVQYLCGH